MTDPERDSWKQGGVPNHEQDAAYTMYAGRYRDGDGSGDGGAANRTVTSKPPEARR